jgi:Domain of unknown function (DUF4915)
VNILISHCNTEDCSIFGLSCYDTEKQQSYLVDIRSANLDRSNDIGLTGICSDNSHIYIAVQSVAGGKILVLSSELCYLNTIELSKAEDLHSIDIVEGILYCTSTRSNSVVSYDLSTGLEAVVWKHDKYVHLNDVKTHEGELYILSQDSLSEMNTGGTISRLSDNFTVVTGLNQPHSLKFYGDMLYVLSSKSGEIKRIRLKDYQSTTLATITGYARGILVDHSRILVGNSAERFHSRKQGEQVKYVTAFDDYLGNPLFRSGIHSFSHQGEPLIYTDFTAINFEIYELFQLNYTPAQGTLLPFPEARKAQFLRLQLNDANQHISDLKSKNRSEKISSPAEIASVSAQLKPGHTDLLRDYAIHLPTFIKEPSKRIARHIRWKRSYFSGAYYFSDAWPINFWNNFHIGKARVELEKYKTFGFNTIFIVIPWSGFHPDPGEKRLNADYMDRAKSFYGLCEKLKLKVITRISYSHCICDESLVEPSERVERLLTKKATYDNWLYYISELQQFGSHSSAKLFFLCWEDFWHPLAGFQKADFVHRLDLAKAIGYQEFIQSKYSLEEYNQLRASSGNSFNYFRDIPIPTNDVPQHRCYLEFMNWRIRSLFDDCRSHIQPLSMEVRVDMDPYKDTEGTVQWFQHDKYDDIGLPILTYWAPFMGAQNKGESLAAEEAITNLNSMIDRYKGIEQIVNQFNFVDRTPEFQGIHAQILEEEVSTFLSRSAEILATRCSGFGLWAIRDYHQNLLYNANFSLATEGWSTSHCKAIKRFIFKTKPGVTLSTNGTLAQDFIPRIRGMGWIHKANRLTLSILCQNFAQDIALQASIEGHGRSILQFDGEEFTANIALNLGHKAKEPLKLVIENIGAQCQIVRICLYHYTFDNGIITSTGKDGRYLSAVKKMTASIKQLVPIFL